MFRFAIEKLTHVMPNGAQRCEASRISPYGRDDSRVDAWDEKHSRTCFWSVEWRRTPRINSTR